MQLCFVAENCSPRKRQKFNGLSKRINALQIDMLFHEKRGSWSEKLESLKESNWRAYSAIFCSI